MPKKSKLPPGMPSLSGPTVTQTDLERMRDNLLRICEEDPLVGAEPAVRRLMSQICDVIEAATLPDPMYLKQQYDHLMRQLSEP